MFFIEIPKAWDGREVIEFIASFELIFTLQIDRHWTGLIPSVPWLDRKSQSCLCIFELRESSKNVLSWFFIFNPFQRKKYSCFFVRPTTPDLSTNLFLSSGILLQVTSTLHHTPFYLEDVHSIFLFCWSCCYRPFLLFRAALMARGGSQARGPIGATVATATSDPSHICNLHHSSRLRQILNSLSRARNWSRNLMVPSQIHFPWATTGTPAPKSLRAVCLLSSPSELQPTRSDLYCYHLPKLLGISHNLPSKFHAFSLCLPLSWFDTSFPKLLLLLSEYPSMRFLPNSKTVSLHHLDSFLSSS